jgi:hypothetical protein
MMLKARVLVQTELNPTEDESKVREAVFNLTSSREFRKMSQGRKTYLVQEGDERLLSPLRSLLRRERILDAARKIIGRSLEDNSFTFCLNKQVAMAGHASFCNLRGESPLGPILFQVTTDDPNSLIDWLATRTSGGIPVDETCPSESQLSAYSEKPSKKWTSS